MSELFKGSESGAAALETLIKRYDLDGDSMLDLGEFPDFIDKVLQPQKDETLFHLNLMFEQIDADGDGSITEAEMLNARMMKDVETQELLFNEEEIAARVSKNDIDGDGKLQLQEWLLHMEEEL